MNYLLDFGLFQAVWKIHKWWILGSFWRDPFLNSSEFGENTHLIGESDELFLRFFENDHCKLQNPTRWRDGNFRSQILSDDDTTNRSSVFGIWCHHFYCHHLMKKHPQWPTQNNLNFPVPNPRGHCWRPLESDSKPKKVRKAKALAELSSTRSQSSRKVQQNRGSFMVIY